VVPYLVVDKLIDEADSAPEEAVALRDPLVTHWMAVLEEQDRYHRFRVRGVVIVRIAHLCVLNVVDVTDGVTELADPETRPLIRRPIALDEASKIDLMQVKRQLGLRISAVVYTHIG